MSAGKAGPRDRELGRQLARLREKAGLTQARMGELLGISHQQYGKYERGENQLTVSRYREILAIFETHSPVPGFGEAHQRDYFALDQHMALQALVDRLRQRGDSLLGDLALLQQEVDRLLPRG